jgi:hypothetical protein
MLVKICGADFYSKLTVYDKVIYNQYIFISSQLLIDISIALCNLTHSQTIYNH